MYQGDKTHDSNQREVRILRQHLECSKNKSSGFNVGVAIQFGNGVNAGITAVDLGWKARTARPRLKAAKIQIFSVLKSKANG
ncbi:hypothetical protein BKG89_04125 [Rodentibacter caecimuris]|uniref:Uncharacterized protein n=1 Tax=Rodentibacter caecimuris TaxID=1796644 RepID=A0ABX3KZ70_9PAST|nr:hypothetical protein BKG89_04125 [Rodentibacter heylii]